MAHKPKSSVEVHLDADRKRQARQARQFLAMNQAAFNGMLSNADVLARGAAVNMLKGAVLPAVIASQENKRRRRGR